MIRPGRRGVYLIGAALLVVALVGGRWLAVETAERAWARTFVGGAALIEVRTLAVLLRGLVIAFAIAWTTGNLLVVYRSIGSVQMPRRLGNLEIVEAVPHRVLFALTIAVGVLTGLLLSLGAGDWWHAAVLAAAPPRLGIAEETLGHDVGYYLGVLPWRSLLQARAMLLATSVTIGIAILYGAIGALRVRRARILASDRARRHLGLLLAALGLVIAWGAILDPAQVIAGLHGPVDEAALTARLPGARFVAAVAVLATLVSLAWAWRDWPNLIIGGWSALVLAVVACYAIIPGIVRASGGRDDDGALLSARRAALERVAFGLAPLDGAAPTAFPSTAAAIRQLPLWDTERVAAVVGAPPVAIALRAPAEAPALRASWLVAPTAAPAMPRIAEETDTGLALRPIPTTDSAVWFGPGVRGVAVASPDTWPALRAAGIPLAGAWRRAALAWTLQGAQLARSETDGRVLLWRRDIVERLTHLAPFATFGPPVPAISDSAIWWVSWGYVASASFPFTRAQPWRGRDVRYLRAGLVGAVRVATGETHVWLAPGYDSLTAVWARHFDPLIEPGSRIPPALRAQLPYPEEAFAAAVTQLVRGRADSSWRPRPRIGFQVPVDGELWTGIGLESGAPPRFEGVLAGSIGRAGDPHLTLWRPARPTRLPGEVVGSQAVRPGTLRMWRAGSAVVSVQAQFVHPAGEAPPRPEVAQVYVSQDERSGNAPTALAALRGGAPIDTSLAARWDRARRLVLQADSALGTGDLELFGRLFRQLARLLAPGSRPR
ncbi:MAG: UPF0182 family protein [Gemmatimonadales bacterium]|nr:UPF0182 family protein [Gemmatimonadales bacterium]